MMDKSNPVLKPPAALLQKYASAFSLIGARTQVPFWDNTTVVQLDY
jgi:hypothetical protein